ncbi:hypothetical protein P3102_16420 [Amycolatopsis sp. QT-25]|uniref:hypothetical protein n=1 Tax=Amycolatopsis sp. QT-25 TaxID=3034022 RepID=UPI0023EC7D7D|nr:hypothetical protein [Amycolatopsis sp. QT-25]WET82675.1 hypothetical protein P3102_16420 [Amycolatopsis sp. QT-25]
MKSRMAALAAAVTFMVSAGAVTASPAGADPVPGNPQQFYVSCAVDLLGSPVSCLESDEAHATHVCQYVFTMFGIGLDCIQR